MNQTSEPIKPVFPITKWTLIQNAKGTDQSLSQKAFSELCNTYWKPIYAFLRKRGYKHMDAEDLTQSFFQNLIHNTLLEKANANKGKFRTYVLTCLKNFIANEYKKQTAQKRGEGQIINCAMNEEDFFIHSKDPQETPDVLFDKYWADTVLQNAILSMREKWESKRKGKLFDILVDTFTGKSKIIGYKELANSIGVTESKIKVTVHRLKKEYKEAILSQIKETTNSQDDLDEEIKHLIKIIQISQ